MTEQEKKTTKPAKPATHPTFKVMVSQAIISLGDAKGSSRQAIRKYIIANYVVSDASLKLNLKKALAKMVAGGEIIHPKASKGSFKFSDDKKAKVGRPKVTDAHKAKRNKTVKKTVKASPKAVPKKSKGTPKKITIKKASKKSPKKIAKKPTVKKSTKKAGKKAKVRTGRRPAIKAAK